MLPNYTEHERQLVKKFCDHVFHILILHHEYCALKEYFDKNPHMFSKAVGFFDNMARSMQFHLLLDFAKVTDPAWTRVRGAKKSNLSVSHLLQNVQCWPNEIKKDLSHLKQEIEHFRPCIIDARNKVLAHNDVQTFLNDEVHGKFPKEEGELFLQNLKDFADKVHRACIGTPFDPILTFPGDVHEFCKLFEKADMFDLLQENDPNKSRELISMYIRSQLNKNNDPKDQPL